MKAATDILKRYHVDGYRSVSLAIKQIGDFIDASPDPLFISNKIVSDLGGKPHEQVVEAGLLARCLIEQAWLLRDDYDPATAYAYAEQKVEKLRKTMPYLWTSVQNTSSSVVNEKSTVAQRIFLDNQEKKGTEIARLIAAELDIPEASAAYYVTKFRKQSK